MQELTLQEISVVGGAKVNEEGAYAASLGAAGAFLGLGAVVTAPAWVPVAFLGASIAASAMAIYYAW